MSVPNVLDEAREIIFGEREAKYGHPLDNFTLIANFWSLILGKEVTAEQTALCMVGVKIAREMHQHKRDNIVDGAGYFGVLDRIISERLVRSEGLINTP